MSAWGAAATFVPSGVDLERFTIPDLAQHEAARARLGVERKDRLILHVGHLSRHRMQVGEITRLAAAPGRRIVVIGSTDTPQDPDVVRTLQQAGATVIQEYVPRIEAVYGAADVYLFPTREKRSSIGVPLSILEALACGLSVVSTPFEGLPRLFPDSAYVRFAESTQDIDRALEEAPPPRDPRARALVEPLSWERVAAVVEALLESLSRATARGERV
jgi:glycosyltransferase involved in cell wall biosynthesis